MLDRGLGCLGGSILGVDGAGALHGWGWAGSSDASSLAACGGGEILLLGRGGRGGGGLGGAVALRGDVVVDSAHVVVQVPSTRESISRDGSLTTFPEAQVGVISMAM